MLRITVELVPFGIEARARTLAKMEIANDGTGTRDSGNYIGTLTAEYTDGRGGRVFDFPRRRQSVWSLVGAFLKLWGHTKHSPRLMEKVTSTQSAVDHGPQKQPASSRQVNAGYIRLLQDLSSGEGKG